MDPERRVDKHFDDNTPAETSGATALELTQEAVKPPDARHFDSLQQTEKGARGTDAD
jgi:hypothetical protein